MPPIKLGIVGLSATNSWAVRAHLPYLRTSSRYTITGVANRSLASSQQAIGAHGLGSTAQPYASVSALARSPDIDLVIVSVRVDQHYDALKPVLEAKKDVLVEWPLASNQQQAEELLRLAEQQGVRTYVGLQGHQNPVLASIKDLVNVQERVGKVLSSSITAVDGFSIATSTPAFQYFNDKAVGATLLTVFFAHLIDATLTVLGELRTVSTTLSTQYPQVELRSDDRTQALGHIPRTSADHIALTGLLASGAHATATMRSGPSFPGASKLVWRIFGTRGQLELTAPTLLDFFFSGPTTLRVHDFATDAVEEVAVPTRGADERWAQDVPDVALNVGRAYEAIADGRWVPDWAWAVQRHAMLTAIEASAERGRATAYL